MSELIFPKSYDPKLTLRETQRAIKLIKDTFQKELALALNLDRVTAPILVKQGKGLNDDLSGVERKVSFTMSQVEGTAEVVQSLAKWKRTALHRYGYRVGEGIYTDMNAIRRDDKVDNTHSIFVDQWDWEKVIRAEDRTLDYLKHTVRAIVGALSRTKGYINKAYPKLETTMGDEVTFVTSQELEDRYPDLSGKEREDAVTREHGIVFLMQIGGVLKSGMPHDSRAPDYDDWSLNGDILVWDPILGHALEISSMGIRVDSEAMDRQLTIAGTDDRRVYPYHRMILDGTLPLTIGGGIGQSRLCMLLLEKAHIGEVQTSIWPEEMISECAENGITLL
ncbi:MAG: aspartate--ammonia ligase [Clostridia bacterium]|nr:aspartate--ammonia ligase [Clostridia bacterium]